MTRGGWQRYALSCRVTPNTNIAQKPSFLDFDVGILTLSVNRFLIGSREPVTLLTDLALEHIQLSRYTFTSS
jgi:hypothetical protein